VLPGGNPPPILCYGLNGSGQPAPCVFSGGGGSGTVTNIATTGPITGGPITTTGTIACPTCGVTGSPLSQFASTTSAQLAGVLSDETGTGAAVFGTGPTITLANGSGLPLSTGVTGNLPNANLASQTANTVLGALTATTPSGLALPSCSGATNALIWTSGTGFGCNTISGLTNPMTTLGDVIYGGASGVATRLAGPTGGAGTYFLIDVPTTTSAVAETFSVAATGTGAPVLATSPSIASPTFTGTVTTPLTTAGLVTTSSGGVLSSEANATIAQGGTNATSAVAGTVPNATSGTASSWTATPTLGASGTLGSIAFGNATSGTVTIAPVTGALGSVTASLPANTGTIAELNLAQTFSATQTFGTATASAFTTSGVTNNLAITATNAQVHQTAAYLQFAGSSGNGVRVAISGQGATTLTVGDNYSSFLVGNAILTTAASGTHTWLANEAVIAPAVTGGGATVTNETNVYIGPAGAAGTNNYSEYVNGPFAAGTYATTSNCSSAASPAVCGAASAGSVQIPTGTTSETLTVNTTAVTANSQIVFYPDDSLGTRLGVTCNSTLATLVGGSFISARTPGTSFTITFNGTILTNGVCGGYYIIN